MLRNFQAEAKKMDFFASFGIFLGGVGILLIGCGLMWFFSVWSKDK
jgi:hypothetical protein